MLDRWFDGMKNTVTNVEKWGFDHVGAYRTQEERNTPVVKEINGIKIGFVAYTHTTNTQERVCDEDAVKYGVPYLYKANIANDIKKLRNAGAEVVIAFPHWGDEYVRKPDDNQLAYAKKLAKAGADIIIGSHSHMVQPMGYQSVALSDGNKKSVFLMFSMGNFISDHTMEYTDSGIILDFTINEQPDGTFTCDNVGYIPTYCWTHDSTVQIVAPSQYLNRAPAGMDNATYNKMMSRYNGTIALIGNEFPVLNR
jgi:poly-gamma-glutamate synthesis protein (capsule biosynthesis protein)